MAVVKDQLKERGVFVLCAGGTEVEVAPFGATITAVRVPDAAGVVADVALGCGGGDASAWETQPQHPYLGSTVGRVANRIGGARFVLDGRTYAVTANERGTTCLHGGGGFSAKRWNVVSAAAAVDGSDATVVLERTSADGEDGFPGELHCTATFSVAASDGALRVEYGAKLAAGAATATVVNMTNHTYWNLGGAGCGRNVLGHVLTLRASQTTAMDPDTLVPTGELLPVQGTCLDFRTPRAIGDRIGEALGGRGYDHNFVLDGWQPAGTKTLLLRAVARLHDPVSGRVLEVSTTQPGLQVYSGNWLDDADIVAKKSVAAVGGGSSESRYARWDGVALETQHFPDSPNHPHFPSTVLRPGEEYNEATVFSFSCC